jgi:hypothetical protein
MTSTLYTTKYFTVTACPPAVTNCPIGAVSSSVYATATTQIQQWNPSNTKAYQPPVPTKVVPPVIATTFLRSTTKVYETPVNTPVNTPKPVEPSINTPKPTEAPVTTSKPAYEKPAVPTYPVY